MHVPNKPVVTCGALFIISALLFHVSAAGLKPKSTASLKERSGAQAAVVHARAAFVFPSPDETTEILKLLKKGEEVRLLDRKVDDLDRLWYLLRDRTGDSGWVESHDLMITSGAADSAKAPGKGGDEPVTISKLSKKDKAAIHQKPSRPGSQDQETHQGRFHRHGHGGKGRQGLPGGSGCETQSSASETRRNAYMDISP